MPVISSDHLLEQADRLVALGHRAPRQADLRRAISAAYYALFHAVLTDAADDFVGRTHRHTARYSLLYRSIDHRSLRELCKDITKPSLPDKYSKYLPAGGFGADLNALATALVDLHEKRQLADYDPLFRAALADVALDIAKARAALVRFRHASRPQRRAFLALLVFSPR